MYLYRKELHIGTLCPTKKVRSEGSAANSHIYVEYNKIQWVTFPNFALLSLPSCLAIAF